MADAAITQGGTLKRGTSQGRPAVAAIFEAAGIRGSGTDGKNRTGTIDMRKIAKGGPKSAMTPATGRSTKREVRSCRPIPNTT